MTENFLEEQLKRIRDMSEQMSRVRNLAAELSQEFERDRGMIRRDPQPPREPRLSSLRPHSTTHGLIPPRRPR